MIAFLWVLACLVGITGGIVFALGVSKRMVDGQQSARSMVAEAAAQTVWVFDGETAIDATDSASAVLKSCSPLSTDWHTLLTYLSPRFPSLITDIDALAARGQITFHSPTQSNVTLVAEHWQGLVRLCLDSAVEPQANGQDAPMHQSELDLLRSTVQDAPYLLWQENREGNVIWANNRYIKRVEAQTDAPQSWPLPKLFETEQLHHTKDTSVTRRLKLQHNDDIWFDVTRVGFGETKLFYACPADQIVKAERSLHHFVQTLTKTFAHLPIGLAIFDKKNELTLFNPALTDLLNIPIEILIGRPSMMTFLDKLRELRMVPEQKNFADWRDRFSQMQVDITDGKFRETWAMPNGATYRVTGCKQSEGTTALMFEDISHQLSAARRFRTELKRYRAVIDASEEAVAVFDATGAMSFCNKSFTALWQCDPTVAFGTMTIIDLHKIWNDRSERSAVWGRIQRSVQADTEQDAWSDEITIHGAGFYAVRVVTLADGRTFVGFLQREPILIEEPLKLEQA